MVKAPDRLIPMTTFDCLLPLCLISFSSLVLQAFTEKEVTTFAEDAQVYKPLYKHLYLFTDTQFEKLSAGKRRTNQIFYSTLRHTVFASAIALTETVPGTSYFREVEELDLKSAFEHEKRRLNATAALVFDNQESFKTLEEQNAGLEEEIAGLEEEIAKLKENIAETEIVSAGTIVYIDAQEPEDEQPCYKFVRQRLEKYRREKASGVAAKPNDVNLQQSSYKEGDDEEDNQESVPLPGSYKEGDDEEDNQESVPLSGRLRPRTGNTKGGGAVVYLDNEAEEADDEEAQFT